ncbi:MAG TPA: Uma2 family endonuclease [Pseudonocardiaceae bacterium]|jgi:Uma2 family endonuclease|nr:Uma2 family endonuclease [Pseudonocardiaceae bacterium]
MTALPEPPGRLLTVEAYAALGEDDRYRSELQEGNLVMSPSPVPDHMIVMRNLLIRLDEQLPPDLQVIPDIDVDLELTPRGKPGFVRRPDLVVVHQTAVERVRHDGGMLRACEVLVIVEIVSPGSQRTDHVIKRGEYADAGIPHYWIVDLDGPVTLTACHLAGEFGYQDAGPVPGRFSTTEPFPVSLRLDGLLPG